VSLIKKPDVENIDILEFKIELSMLSFIIKFVVTQFEQEDIKLMINNVNINRKEYLLIFYLFL
jgi:hypothetical protein